MTNEYEIFNFLEEDYSTSKTIKKINRRNMRGHCNMFSLDEYEFIKRYRLTKVLAQNLCDELRPLLKRTTKSTDLTVETKVLTAVFLRDGIVPTACRQLRGACYGTTDSIFNNFRNYKCSQLSNYKRKIQDRNRIKVEFVMQNMQIISVDASHGGANHDSFIWSHHPLQPHLEDLFNSEKNWLLGDSGYPLRRTVMTPFLHAIPGSPEAHYTNLHVRARNCIERTMGLLKSRFRCLIVHRVLHYSPETAGLIVNACVILHNISNKANTPVQQLNIEEGTQEDHLGTTVADELPTSNVGLQQGYATRSALIQQLWERRQSI